MSDSDIDLPGIDDFELPGLTPRKETPEEKPSDSDSELEQALKSVETKFQRPATTAETQKKPSESGNRASTAPHKTLLKSKSSLESSHEEQKSLKSSADKRSNDPIKDLEQRIAEIQKQTKDELEEEKQKLQKTYEESTQQTKQRLQAAYEVKKQMYEQQISELEQSRQIYEKIEGLADSVSFNSNLLNSLSKQLAEQKETQDVNKSQKILNLERSIQETEKRISQQEKEVQTQKQEVQDQLKSLEKSEGESKKLFLEQQAQIAKEKEYIYEFFKTIKEKEHTNKQEYEFKLEKIKAEQESLEKKKQNLEEEKMTQLENIKLQEEILEKKEKENQKQISNLRKEISDLKHRLEETRSKNSGLEEDYNKRLSGVEDREKDLYKKLETLNKQKHEVHIQRQEFDREIYKIHQLSLELHNQSEVIGRSKTENEKEKAELSRIQREVENINSTAEAEMSAARDLSKSLSYEVKTYERMRCMLVQELHSSLTSQTFAEYSSHPEWNFEVYKPKYTGSSMSFNHNSYMKEMERYNGSRENLHDFIFEEQDNLLKSKLQSESQATESWANSVKSPQASKFGEHLEESS